MRIPSPENKLSGSAQAGSPLSGLKEEPPVFHQPNELNTRGEFMQHSQASIFDQLAPRGYTGTAITMFPEEQLE